MKRLVKDTNTEYENIFCMSNIAGKRVRKDGPLEISFYFGSKDNYNTKINHGIRIKFSINSERYLPHENYYLELHGDYKCSNEDKIPSRILRNIRNFFKKYKVLFAGAWESEIPEDDIVAYLRGFIPLRELIEDCYFYSKYEEKLQNISTISAFEKAVRKYNIFNMND